MKRALAICWSLLVCFSAIAQEQPRSVTVPITLDHNRTIIDVYIPLSDGTSKRVRAWVDSGNSDMTMSKRIASLVGTVTCNGQACNAAPPSGILIGGKKISLTGIREVQAPAGDPTDVMDPGMSAEVNLPSTVLHNYDVLIDYPNRQFTIGEPGSIRFKGNSAKALIIASGLVQIPSKIEDQECNLALDIGASISVVSSGLLSDWQTAHPKWPSMTGAVGPANMWGMPDESQWSMARLPAIQFGATRLEEVVVAPFGKERLEFFEKRAGVPTVGLVGGNALRQYQVGIDYANSTVYLNRLTPPTPDMDFVGLTLHPELDGRFTILGIITYDGKPAVAEVKPGDVLVGVDGAPATGATMGQVWSLLGGTPGQTRALTLERDGKRFTVQATVRRFLAASRTAVKSPRRNPHARN